MCGVRAKPPDRGSQAEADRGTVVRGCLAGSHPSRRLRARRLSSSPFSPRSPWCSRLLVAWRATSSALAQAPTSPRLVLRASGREIVWRRLSSGHETFVGLSGRARKPAIGRPTGPPTAPHAIARSRPALKRAGTPAPRRHRSSPRSARKGSLVRPRSPSPVSRCNARTSSRAATATTATPCRLAGKRARSLVAAARGRSGG